MEKINAVDHSFVGNIILVTMTDLCKKLKKDISQVFKDVDAIVDVRMTVNGIEVPILETLNKLYSEYDKEVQERAERLAFEMVSEAGLDPLRAALEDASWKIQDALRKAIK